jgi:hypothetical protein
MVPPAGKLQIVWGESSLATVASLMIRGARIVSMSEAPADLSDPVQEPSYTPEATNTPTPSVQSSTLTELMCGYGVESPDQLPPDVLAQHGFTPDGTPQGGSW